MKPTRHLVITDGYALNPHDFSWEMIEKFGKLMVYDRTSPEELIERAKNAHILLINKVRIDEYILSQLPDLQLICVLATGYNGVDLEAARRRNIPVCNVPTYGTDAVAQHTFALILELCHQVGKHSEGVRQNEWAKQSEWCYWKSPIIELTDKTLGIIGFGKIGQKTAEIGRAFGMKIVVFTPNPTSKSTKNIHFADLQTVFRTSDFVSLHCALTQENFRLVNASLLSLMKPSAFLINTGRGDLIDEHDLVQALRNQQIAGVGLDVLSQEPPPMHHPLFQFSNCIITPHHAWASREARLRLLTMVRDNIQAFLEGNPKNVVNFV